MVSNSASSCPSVHTPIDIRSELEHKGRINRSRLVVVGIGLNAVGGPFKHVRDAHPGPGPQTQERRVNIAEGVQPVKGWVDPVVKWHIDRAIHVRLGH